MKCVQLSAYADLELDLHTVYLEVSPLPQRAENRKRSAAFVLGVVRLVHILSFLHARRSTNVNGAVGEGGREKRTGGQRKETRVAQFFSPSSIFLSFYNA